MAKAVKAKQLGFTIESRVGVLADVTGALAAKKVNINALIAYEMENQGVFMLLTDKTAVAKKALAGLGVEVQEEDVVLVELPDRPGALQSVSEKVADAGIDILYVYATAGRKTGTLCVMQTVDNKKAIKAISG